MFHAPNFLNSVSNLCLSKDLKWRVSVITFSLTFNLPSYIVKYLIMYHRIEHYYTALYPHIEQT